MTFWHPFLGWKQIVENRANFRGKLAVFTRCPASHNVDSRLLRLKATNLIHKFDNTKAARYVLFVRDSLDIEDCSRVCLESPLDLLKLKRVDIPMLIKLAERVNGKENKYFISTQGEILAKPSRNFGETPAALESSGR